MAEQVKLDEVGKAILKALARCKDPAGCGEIAVKAGLPTPKVTGKMRGLLKGGFVATPSQLLCERRSRMLPSRSLTTEGPCHRWETL